MKMLKSYHMFCTKGLRLIFALLAAALLILQYWTQAFLGMNSAILACGILMMSGIVLDHWIFGGSCAKGSQGLDYLKSSARGKRVFGHALKGDCLYRFLTDTLALGGGAAISLLFTASGPEPLTDPVQILYGMVGMVAASYGLTTLTLLISRHWTMLGYSLCAAWVSSIVLLLLLWLQAVLTWTILLTAVLCVPLTRMSVTRVLRKMEESYHDGMEP